jgi:hypothetical protein
MLSFSIFIDSGPDQYKDVPICVQLVGYRHADEALANAAAMVDSIVNGRDDSAEGHA